MARHVNWNPTKHRRLPNGQWAPSGRGKIVISQKPRSYASRRTHASQVGHLKVVQQRKAKRRARRNASIAVAAGVVAVTGAGLASHYVKTVAAGGPRR